MKTYVSYRKLSKKKQQEINQTKRITWGQVSPVTKMVTSGKVYSRKKAQRQSEDPPELGFFDASNFRPQIFVRNILEIPLTTLVNRSMIDRSGQSKGSDVHY